MILPKGKEKYDIFNLCSAVFGSVSSLLLFSALSIASMVPLIFSIPMICLSTAIVVSSCISLFGKVHLAGKVVKHVSWADNISTSHEAPAEIFTCSI